MLLCCWVCRQWGSEHSFSLIASEGKEADEAPRDWFMSWLVLREKMRFLLAEHVLCHAKGISFTLTGDIHCLGRRKQRDTSRAPLRPYRLIIKRSFEKKSCKEGQGQHTLISLLSEESLTHLKVCQCYSVREGV